MTWFRAFVDATVERPRHCQLWTITQMSGWWSPWAGILTSEAAGPRFFAVHTARLGFSSATGNVCLYLSTIALHHFPFGARRTRPRVANVRTRMVAAGEILVTNIPTRNTLGGTGLQGGNIRALVRKHFTAAITRDLARNLAGRAGSGMTEHGTRMTACSWPRTKITARVGCCQPGGFGIGFRSTETPGERNRLAFD